MPPVATMHALPLPALVAVDEPRLALLLLLVEPRLAGVVLGGPVGTGKTALARGARALLPPSVPWVELPLGSDAEALLGGLDLEATLRTGARVLRPGLLARADGGVLLVDAINLLPDSAVNSLLAALEAGRVTLERDGISASIPARFRVLGSYDPAEGPPRAHLLDRIGLIVSMPGSGAAAARAEILRRHALPATGDWELELESLTELIATAVELLPQVELGAAQLQDLAAMAEACGVEGQRGEYFAALAARASAALALRTEVLDEDLAVAARLTLLPRATRRPAGGDDAPPPPAEPPPSPADPDESDADGSDADVPRPVEELLEALAVAMPRVLDELPFRTARRAAGGSRGSTAGTRGRHYASVPGSPRGARVDVVATLRQAARWQRLRARAPGRVAVRADDIRIRRFRSKASALFVFAVDASGSMALNRMRQAKGAVQALLQQAYVHRDRVALLAFRGEGAELLLPPTNSVELAQRALNSLPTGGGTPIAAALLAALELAGRAQRRGAGNVVLVLLTDGRANVGLRSGRDRVDEELEQLARGVVAAGITSLVVDTQRNFLGGGRAERLAAWLGGRYLYLPGAGAAGIAAAARDAVDRRQGP